jgi:hypothetical protein
MKPHNHWAAALTELNANRKKYEAKFNLRPSVKRGLQCTAFRGIYGKSREHKYGEYGQKFGPKNSQ